MAEITYRSPGFFESEIDLSVTNPAAVTATPAGVIGPSPIGPAFVPVTVTSLNQFKDRFFGTVEDKNNSYYSAQEFFRNGQALTFVRTLGVGSTTNATDILTTQAQGTARGAGFAIKSPAAAADGRAIGTTQFIVANHTVPASTDPSYPIFVDNDSFSVSAGGSGTVNLVRGVLLFPTGTRGMVMSYNETYTAANVSDDIASVQPTSTAADYKMFKLVISSSAQAFGTTDGATGLKIYTASLDPASPSYISKILNTSPELFQEKQHLLYMDFAVEDEIASVSTAASSIAILSGSANTSSTSGDPTQIFQNAFGRFDSRYTTPRTTTFISQPFSGKEYDLFYFETIGDGASANKQFKISIANLKRSTDPANPYGTFDILVRDFYDNDRSPIVLEQYSNCTLNPNDANYVAKAIGDKKVYYNFDTTNLQDRKFVSSGQYNNVSTRVRIVMNSDVTKRIVPAESLPFGFAGIPTLKTSDALTDTAPASLSRRLSAVGTTNLTASIVPPVPLRYKVTTNSTTATPTFAGDAGTEETANVNLYWGVKFDPMPSVASSLGSGAYLQSNGDPGTLNPLIETLSKFTGITKLDTLTTGSAVSAMCNNKFTLARVALYNSKGGGTALNAAVNNLTGTIDQHMLNAIYVRNGVPDASDCTITDGSIAGRLTLGSLALISSSSIFNRFSPYVKFTNMFYGGFDGLNILDKDMSLMNDRSTSSEIGGKAVAGLNIGLNTGANSFTSGPTNSLVSSYRAAVDIMTNPGSSRANVFSIPGIRDTQIADYALLATKNTARSLYIMDIPAYTDVGTRIFTTTTLPDVNYTIRQFAGRNVNNSYGATYFPDVSIADDGVANKKVRVPASVVALGALAQNDAKSYPWYAPAGFNRTSLSSVANLAVRLTSADRDNLYDSRINPITAFPGLGYVIFGQKTLQIARTALDRVNVRRLMIELARIVTAIGLQFVFEPNTPATRSRFKNLITPQLATVQANSGIDGFKIIMDETNNTQQDIESNRLNGKIIVIPTKAVEYIAIDFIITNAGVQFV